MHPDLAARSLVAATRDLVFSLADDGAANFRPLWPAALALAATTPADGESLPVLRWLDCVAKRPRAFGGPLTALLCDAAPLLTWRQTYARPDVDATFLDNYGYTDLIGPHAPVPSERMACGFLLLGPDTLYPQHRHAAEETYVSLSGAAAWRQGDGGWRTFPPAAVVHHASFEAHAMRTAGEPLLALYLWRGEVRPRARLDAAAAAGETS